MKTHKTETAGWNLEANNVYYSPPGYHIVCEQTRGVAVVIHMATTVVEAYSSPPPPSISLPLFDGMCALL